MSKDIVERGRVSREKEWHNQNHGKDVRAPAVKYYSIAGGEDWNESIVRSLDSNVTNLLDYGCGTGKYLLNVAHRIKRGVGIDISEANIEEARNVARERGIQNLEFFVMDAMNTTFENHEFDIVRGGGILHHLDVGKSLQEIKRVLKNDNVGGGSLFHRASCHKPFHPILSVAYSPDEDC
jgi:ubiquinone/menaquinone biosynthesis C-methylase UbiE